MAQYSPFTVTVSTVAGSLFDGTASQLSVPSVMGVTTILANHEPLIALLAPGTISLIDERGEHRTYPVRGGVLEVSHNKAIVLVS